RRKPLPARWRLLQMAGVGVLCVVFAVVLGLVLGPRLTEPSPQAGAPRAAAPPAAADVPAAPPLVPGVAEVAPAKVPAEPSARPAPDEEITKQITAEALN